MLSLEQQVCSLELAKRLKELGVKQESYFYWCLPSENANGGLPSYYQLADIVRLEKSCFWPSDKISAFTVAELLALLPHRVTLSEGEPYNSFRLRIEKGIWCKDEIVDPAKICMTEFYSVNYYCDSTSESMDWMFAQMIQNISDENCADAIAKMLVYLIENKLMELPNGE